ncbi:hypothetical protein RJ55_04820 [Drechmeria coniospora]|nr:hypothetical protein RJ55_04820 [Drechmeria coniospora]
MDESCAGVRGSRVNSNDSGRQFARTSDFQSQRLSKTIANSGIIHMITAILPMRRSIAKSTGKVTVARGLLASPTKLVIMHRQYRRINSNLQRFQDWPTTGGRTLKHDGGDDCCRGRRRRWGVWREPGARIMYIEQLYRFEEQANAQT